MPRPSSTCPACSARTRPKARFCSSCGQALTGSVERPRSPWRRRIGLSLVGLIGLLAVIGAFADDPKDTVQPGEVAAGQAQPTRRVGATATDPASDTPTPKATATTVVATVSAPPDAPSVTGCPIFPSYGAARDFYADDPAAGVACGVFIRAEPATEAAATERPTEPLAPTDPPTPEPSLRTASSRAAALIPTDAPDPTATAQPTEIPAPTATAVPALPDGIPHDAMKTTVLRVVDGDTIEVQADGPSVTVRLIGIDTPETVDPNEPDGCYGAEASDFAARLLDGRTVYLEADSDRTDRYDRWLRYVWLVPRSGGDPYLANEHLVAEGYAVALSVGSNDRHEDRIADAEDAAEGAGLGLWSACDAEPTPLPPAPTSVPRPTAEPLVADCSPFASFAEAEAYYDAHPDAQAILDPNLDGRACEYYFGVDVPAAPVLVAAPDQSQAQGILANPGGGGCTYVNVDGNVVPCPVESPVAPPGATAQCNDGTWSFSQNRRGTCSGHGGVAYWL